MSLLDFLQQSRAPEPFRTAVAQFMRDGQPNDRVEFDGRSPPVKIERMLMQILEHYPELAIERVEIDARSGCEFFRGTASIHSADDTSRRVAFHWNCRWRAEEQGWTDCFGFPDQARAAREFGHRCFQLWTEEESAAYSS